MGFICDKYDALSPELTAATPEAKIDEAIDLTWVPTTPEMDGHKYKISWYAAHDPVTGTHTGDIEYQHFCRGVTKNYCSISVREMYDLVGLNTYIMFKVLHVNRCFDLGEYSNFATYILESCADEAGETQGCVRAKLINPFKQPNSFPAPENATSDTVAEGGVVTVPDVTTTETTETTVVTVPDVAVVDTVTVPDVDVVDTETVTVPDVDIVGVDTVSVDDVVVDTDISGIDVDTTTVDVPSDIDVGTIETVDTVDLTGGLVDVESVDVDIGGGIDGLDLGDIDIDGSIDVDDVPGDIDLGDLGRRT